MAEVILEELDLGQTPQLRLTTLELASRLPVFAKRAGFFFEAIRARTASPLLHARVSGRR